MSEKDDNLTNNVLSGSFEEENIEVTGKAVNLDDLAKESFLQKLLKILKALF